MCGEMDRYFWEKFYKQILNIKNITYTRKYKEI